MVNDTIYKFDKHCNPLPYYGNTIISYLNDEKYPIFLAAKKIQSEIKSMEFSDHLAFLPPDSFHMTVLTLCREIDRHTQYWPPMVPQNAKFKEVDRTLKEIVDKIPVPKDVWIEVDECEITRIVLKPADETSSRKLLNYRDQVAEKTGILHSWHKGFRYHLSLDYLVKPFNMEQEEIKQQVCAEFTNRLKREIKPFILTKPEFAIFNDMMSYERNIELRGNQY